MQKLLKIADKMEADLKKYREKQDSSKVENLVNKALSKHEGDDIDLSYNNQHYGWFVWDSEGSKHKQRDMNDFEADDKIQDVRKFVKSLKKINLEDYE